MDGFFTCRSGLNYGARVQSLEASLDAAIGVQDDGDEDTSFWIPAVIHPHR